MREPRYLVDSSVLGRAHQPIVGERLQELELHGRLWTCRMTDLEVVYAARTRDVPGVVAARRALPEAAITPETMDRALDVMAELAARHHHRGVKPADCVIAASAEARGLGVLHYDDDFDRIAEVTGQHTEWVAPRGSLD